MEFGAVTSMPICSLKSNGAFLEKACSYRNVPIMLIKDYVQNSPEFLAVSFVRLPFAVAKRRF